MITGRSTVRAMEGVRQQAGQRQLDGIQATALPIFISGVSEGPGEESRTFSPCERNDDEGVNGASPLRRRNLSEREMQILDSLVKGHANKVIARTCAISEATVKVHMKSILQENPGREPDTGCRLGPRAWLL